MINTEHLQPGCPWYDLSEFKIPNVKWCEENLCQWVVNPANTWSNLLYIILGVMFMWRGQKNNRKTIIWAGGAMVFMGMCSLIYHASYTFVLQILDFIGMYVFTNLLICINLVRLQKISQKTAVQMYWISVFAVTAFTTVLGWFHLPIQGIMLVLAVGIAWTEYKVQKSNSPYKAVGVKNIFIGGATMVVALACSIADVSRFWCDPTNHIVQGHAAWHVIGAIGLSFVILHHESAKEVLT